MSRPLRIQFKNAYYHVMSRGDLKRRIFKKSSFKLKFIEKINDMCNKFNVECFAYCVMDNHYHLFIQTPDGNISNAIKYLNESYANWYRVFSQKPGHVFQGRFKSVLVDHNNYSLTLVDYIHLNPLNAKIVDRPEDYRYSSLNYYLGKKRNNIEKLNRNFILFQFDSNLRIASKKYYEHLMKNSLCDDLKANTYKSIAIGNRDFIENIENKLKEIPKNIELLSTNMDKSRYPDEIIELVKKEFKITEEDIFKKKRNNFFRKITIYLLKIYTRMKSEEIGEMFDIKRNSVSSVVKSVRDTLNEDLSLEKLLQRLKP